MNRFRNGAILLAVFAGIVVSATAAMAQRTRFQQVVEVKIRPGQEAAYEEIFHKYKEAADKTGSSFRWTVIMVSVGKAHPTYRIVLPFDKWAEIDGWQEDILEKAFGKEEATAIWKRAGALEESSSSRIWETRPDLSANPGGGAANHFEVSIRTVRPGMVEEYELLLKPFKQAYEAMPNKPRVGRSVLRMGKDPNRTYRRASAFDKWADRDSFNAPEALAKYFGEERAELIFARFQSCIETQEVFVSTVRRDLSRQAPGSVSNE